MQNKNMIVVSSILPKDVISRLAAWAAEGDRSLWAIGRTARELAAELPIKRAILDAAIDRRPASPSHLPILPTESAASPACLGYRSRRLVGGKRGGELEENSVIRKIRITAEATDWLTAREIPCAKWK